MASNMTQPPEQEHIELPPLLPINVYATLRKERNPFLLTWATYLPCQASVVEKPLLLDFICGTKIGVGHFVSHELLIMYRCTLWYLPQLLKAQSESNKDFCETVDWQEYIKQINLGIQYHQKRIYEKAKIEIISVIEIIHVFEDAILKCIMLSKLLSTKKEAVRDDLMKAIPAILTMNFQTLQKLGLDGYRTLRSVPDRSNWTPEDTAEIVAWNELKEKYTE